MTEATVKPNALTVDLADLRTLFAMVLPFAGDDHMLPVLASIRLEGRCGRLIAMATDRYSLGVGRLPVEGADGFEALIKAKDVRHILSTFKNRKAVQSKVALTVADGSVTVSLVDGLFADADDLTARYSLVDGTFPKVLGIFRDWKPSDSSATGVNPAYLARFQHVTAHREEPIRVSIGSGTSPVVVQAGDYFLGAIMPVRMAAGSGPVELSDWIEAAVEPEAVAS